MINKFIGKRYTDTSGYHWTITEYIQSRDAWIATAVHQQEYQRSTTIFSTEDLEQLNSLK